MSTRKDQLLRRMSGKKGRAVALTREEKALRDVAEMLEKTGGSGIDMSGYVKKPELSEYAKKTDIPTVPDMTGLATETYVADAISTAITGAMEASY